VVILDLITQEIPAVIQGDLVIILDLTTLEALGDQGHVHNRDIRDTPAILAQYPIQVDLVVDNK
jgi:hypothetical protein